MRRVTLLATALLVGCGHPEPLTIAACPPEIPVPAPIPRIRTTQMVSALQIREDLAREAERARGNACAQSNSELTAWVQAHGGKIQTKPVAK